MKKTLISPGVRHIMIDIETLDTTPDAPILSVAAAPFGLTHEDDLDLWASVPEDFEHNAEITIAFELPEKTEVNDTFKWHIKNNTGAIENSVKYGTTLHQGLHQLDNFIDAWIAWNPGNPDWRNTDYYIWGWGYGFDMTILTRTYTRTRRDLPGWLSCFHRLIDARTAFFAQGGFWSEYSKTRQGKHHDPLDDVRHQIKTIQDIFSRDN